MTWEQKLAALNSITATRVLMREPGNWYVEAYARMLPDGAHMFRGAYGEGKTPQEAVENDWDQISASPSVYISPNSEEERRVRWNGYMWEEVAK